MNIRNVMGTMIILAFTLSTVSACSSENGNANAAPVISPVIRPAPTGGPVNNPMTTLSPTCTPEPEASPTPVTLPLNKVQQSSEHFSPVLGLCEDYPLGTKVETIEKDFALMAEYGISDMRVSIAWGDYEPVKDKSDWSLLDAEVDLAEKYGIELYPYICYSPSWATGGEWSNPPKDLQVWYDFVYTVADRYKGRINNWELWNEGDNYDFWTGTWEEQLELVKVGAQAVRDASPAAKIIFGGLTDTSPPHINTIYTSGVSDLIDVINIHFYNETWNPTPTEDIYNTIKSVAGIIREHGGKQELWVAEIGYSDYVQKNGQVSDWVKLNAPYEKTREFQAVTFMRAYSRIAATEDISAILWYEIKNLRLDSVAIGDVNNYFLGALDHNYFPKHLWFSIASLKQLFAASYESIDNELTIKKTNAKKPYVHGFRRENGDVVIVAWNRGTENETINVTIPDTFKSALRYSITGEKTPFVYQESGNTTAMNLELKPEYVNVIELFAASTPARITVYNPQISKITEDTYTISATAVNIGGDTAQKITGEIFIGEDLELADDMEIPIDELTPGKEIKLSWKVKVTDSAKSSQIWIVVNHGNSPAAATLINFPE